MNQRLREFDFIRALAALSVIAIHLTASYVTSNSIGAVWNETMRYAVPTFLLLSGVVLMYQDLKKPPLSYLTFQRKRLGKVLWPYLLWSLFYVYYMARDVLKAQGLHGAKRILDTMPDHFKNGDGSYHLYFLLITLQLYLLYPLLRAWMRRSPWTLLVASLALSLYDQFSHYFGHAPWRYDLFPNWLFYFVLGMFVVTKREWMEKHLPKQKIWLGVLWIAGLVVLIADGRITHSSYTSLKPTVMLYAVVSFFFFYAVALGVKATTGRVGKLMDWLSTHSFFIFLVHPFVLNRLYLLSDKYDPKFWNGTKGMIMLYVTTVVITLVVTYVVRLIPLTSFIGAVRPVKRKPVQLNHAQQKSSAL
ncbi:MAG: acyltransferase [Tumebacillaceae bacterium]